MANYKLINSHPDLTLITDFVSEDEESLLLAFVSQNESVGGKERNNIQRFGKFKNEVQVDSRTLPDCIDQIANRIIEFGLLDKKPDCVSVNEYFPGQGIAPHIDSKNNGEVITILGLSSHTVMNFNHSKEEPLSVLFPQRALLQMHRSLRYNWQHSIEPKKVDVIEGIKYPRDKRYSIVFRCSLLK